MYFEMSHERAGFIFILNKLNNRMLSCACEHTLAHVHTHACMQACTHMCTHTHTRAHAHTHTICILLCVFFSFCTNGNLPVFFTIFGQVLQCVVLCVVCHGLSHPNIPWLLGYQPRPTLVAWLPTCMNCGCLVTPVHGHITGWGILRLDMPRLQVYRKGKWGLGDWLVHLVA
jgi:hypothetical protein